jgi:hypothetical protein
VVDGEKGREPEVESAGRVPTPRTLMQGGRTASVENLAMISRACQISLILCPESELCSSVEPGGQGSY